MASHSPGWTLPSIILTAVPALALVFCACSEDPGGQDFKNEPPAVWISGGPPEGSDATYKIDFSWGGYDPDGSIVYFEYCITDNDGAFDPADTTGADKWARTGKTSDTFVFSADRLADSTTTDLVTEFYRSHTFFVRAVDDDGAQSEETAYRSFTAHTLSPTVDILVPGRVGLNPARVPGVFTVRWVADDYVDDLMTRQDPDSVSYLLEPVREHNDDWTETIAWIRDLPVDAPEWGDWNWYQAPEDSGKFWTTPPTDLGNYVFAIRAKDEAGAVTPVFDEDHNMRRVQVGSDGWPLLTVHNRYMGSVVTAVCNTPLTIIDLPAGIPTQFSWTADASHYGGTMAGYRYGWDIVDLDDPSQWEVDFTPFPPHGSGEPASARSQPRAYYFGVHVFTVEVLDNSGFCSRVEIKINVIQFTMSRPLLIVDDFAESQVAGWDGPGRGIEPDDAEHDFFWRSMAENVAGFDPVGDVLDVSHPGAAVPLDLMAGYKSIVWNAGGHVDMVDDFPLLHDLIKFRPKDGAAVYGKVQPDVLALYMAAGGHVMICGRHPVAMSIDKKYTPGGMRFPCMFNYELDLRVHSQERPPHASMIEDPPGDESFPYFDLCLETMDYAESSIRRQRPVWYYCDVADARDIPPDLPEYVRTRTMRAATPIDLSFPRLELRPETAGPGKAHDPNVKGLNVEVYNPQYFFYLCPSVRWSRECFQPIYGLECIETSEPTFGQPVAFWTSTFGDRVADAPGAVAARSVVFGFPPVMFNPEQVSQAMELIFFDEWQLPRN